jgi:hypothetical protein
MVKGERRATLAVVVEHADDEVHSRCEYWTRDWEDETVAKEVWHRLEAEVALLKPSSWIVPMHRGK